MKKKFEEYNLQRLGFYKTNNLERKPSIILYSNAGSELVGTNIFLMQLKKEYPNHSLIIAVDNFEAMDLAKNTITCADEFLFFPHDLKFSVKRFLEFTKPSLVLFFGFILRTHIINECFSRNIVSGLVSGKFRREIMIKKGVERHLASMIKNTSFDKISFFSMQSKEDCEEISRFVKDKNKIQLVGSLKLDLSYSLTTRNEKENLRKTFNLNKKDTVIIAGATYLEESILVDAFKKISLKIQNLKLIIVPRHYEIIPKIEKELFLSNAKFSKYSNLKNRENIILVDKKVNLAKLYSIADVIILGRSFLPYKITKKGGSNILEAAIHGKPIFFGENMVSWKEYVVEILKQKPQLQAKNSEDLAEKITTILKDRIKYAELGGFLKKFCENVLKNQKSIHVKQLKLIKKIMLSFSIG